MSNTEAIAHAAAPQAAPSVAPHARLSPRVWSVLRWALALALVAGAVAGVVRYRSAHAASPVSYETAAVDRGAIAAKVTATGTLSALVTVVVGSQVSGRIDALYADFESQVKKGQTIATIEPSLFRAAVAQARANYLSAVSAVDRARAQLAQAEKAEARAKSLVAEGIASRADY